MAGVVLVDEQLINKSSESFSPDANIRLKGDGDPASRYVSRGGLKLEAALREFHIDAHELTCLDVGSSTGGFFYFLFSPSSPAGLTPALRHNQFQLRAP